MMFSSGADLGKTLHNFDHGRIAMEESNCCESMHQVAIDSHSSWKFLGYDSTLLIKETLNGRMEQAQDRRQRSRRVSC